jgi:hypothetical protein
MNPTVASPDITVASGSKVIITAVNFRVDFFIPYSLIMGRFTVRYYFMLELI